MLSDGDGGLCSCLQCCVDVVQTDPQPYAACVMPHRIRVALLAVVLGTAACCVLDTPWRCLWPPVASLLVIIATRHALAGLLAGGLAGAVMLAGGDPLAALWAVVADHLAPSLRESLEAGRHRVHAGAGGLCGDS